MASISFLCLFCAILTFTSKAEKEKHGLMMIDLQFDFADPSGSLSVFIGGNNGYLNISTDEYFERVNSFIENEKDRFDFIVYSIDYHPTNHCSFASTMQAAGASVNAFDQIFPDKEVGKPYEDDIWYVNKHKCANLTILNTELHSLTQTGYQVLWPDHCLIGSDGAQFMNTLKDIRPLAQDDSDEGLQRVIIWRDPAVDENYVVTYDLAGSYIVDANYSFESEIDHVMSTMNDKITANISQVMYVFKGRDSNIDSYSAFDGNDGQTKTGLYDALSAYDYTPKNTDLTIFGIAYDYCVWFTCRDAANYGFEVTMMDQLTAPVVPADVPGLKEEMLSMGININYSYGAYGNDDVASRDDGDDDNDGDAAKDGMDGAMIAVIILIVVVVALVGVIVWMAVTRPKGTKVAVSDGANSEMTAQSV